MELTQNGSARGISKEQVVELLEKPFVLDYHSRIVTSLLSEEEGATPLFEVVRCIEVMLAHPVIRSALSFYKGAIADAQFEVVRASSPQVAHWAHDQLSRFWQRSRPLVQHSYDYGWGGYEVVYTLEGGWLSFDYLQVFHPRDCFALTKNGELIGTRVKNVRARGARGYRDLWAARKSGGYWMPVGDEERQQYSWVKNQAQDIPAKGFWFTHQPRYERHYGVTQLYGAYRPWQWLAGRDGAEEIIHGGVYRYAYAGAQIFYPPKGMKAGAGAPNKDARQEAQQMAENLKTGFSCAWPSVFDEKGNRLWDFKFPEHTLEVDNILKYADWLEKLVIRGIGIPPEVLEASDGGGSGYSGRMIPLEGYISQQQENAEAIVKSWKDQIGLPLARFNFGPDAHFDIMVKPLLASKMQARQGQEAQKAPGQPGEQDQPQPGTSGELPVQRPPAPRPPVQEQQPAGGQGAQFATDPAVVAKIEKAAAAVDPEPSESQKKSGNYAKGHLTLQGLPITIETPKGATRSGTSPDGKAWESTLSAHYGYIKRTKSQADGDAVDIFIGPDPDSELVFIVDQVKADGSFDEHKALVGWTNEAAAKAGYAANYSPGWKVGKITALTMAEFKDWLENGDTLRPIALATRAPAGGIQLKNKSGTMFDYKGGQFIPEKDIDALPADQKEKLDKAKDAEKSRLRDKGHAGKEALQQRLAPHTAHELNAGQESSAKRAYQALKSHHGELLPHALAVKIEADEKELAKIGDDHPNSEGLREHYGKRLKAYHMMLDWAERDGLDLKPADAKKIEAAKELLDKSASIHAIQPEKKAAPFPDADLPGTITPSPTEAEHAGRTEQPGAGTESDAGAAGRGRRPELGGDDSGSAGRPALKPANERIVTAREHLTKPGNPDLVPASVRQHLDSHQIQGVAKGIAALDEHGGFLLADGTGVGKTRQQLAIAKRFADQGKKVLIVTKSEVIKPDWKKGQVSGSFAADSATLGVPLTLNKGETPLGAGQVHITTYDKLGDLKGKIDKDTLLIYDESHSLKNWGSARAKHGYEAAKNAGKVLYATATPADKPLHIAHLFRAKVFGDRSWDETYRDLGLHQVEVRTPNGTIKKWEINPRVGAAESYRRMSGLFDRMTEDGLMLKREIAFDGVDVGFDNVPLPPEAHDMLERIEKEGVKGANKGLERAMVLMHQRRQQEPYKIPHVVDSVQKELAEGRSVVVFASRVNESQVGGKDGEDAIASSEGTAKALREALEKAGVDNVLELHGGVTPKQRIKAMEAFQGGKGKVIVATVESGGTGINLDDVVGDAPRTLIMMTAPFSAVENVQAAGRVWRLKTKSAPRLRYVFGDTEVDRWNANLIASKMKTLGAAVGGEVAHLDMPTDVSEEGIAEHVAGKGGKVESAEPFKWRPLVGGRGGETGGQQSQARLDVRGNTFAHKESIKAAGGRWDAARGVWTIPPSAQERVARLNGVRIQGGTQEVKTEQPKSAASAAMPSEEQRPAPLTQTMPSAAQITKPTPAEPAPTPVSPPSKPALQTRRVNTAKGERVVHSFSPGNSFWDAWRTWKTRGGKPDYLSVSKNPRTGDWEATVWGATEEETASNAEDLRSKGVRI